MAQLVDLGEQGVVQFPDDASPEEIQSAIDANFPNPSATFFQRQAPIKGASLAAATGVAEQARGTALLSTIPFHEPGMILPKIEREAEARFAAKTPVEKLQQVRESPIYQWGENLQKGAEEAYPLSATEKEGITTKVGTGLGGFVPFVAEGPLGAAGIGLQSMGSHISTDYEAELAKNKTPDEAAQSAINKAFASGAAQATLFKVLPMPLRKLGDKFIDKFARGAISRFLLGRVEQGMTGATLGGASAAIDQAISGEFNAEQLADSAAGLGLIQMLFPRGYTQRELGTPEVRNRLTFGRRGLRAVDRAIAEAEARGAVPGAFRPTAMEAIPPRPVFFPEVRPTQPYVPPEPGPLGVIPPYQPPPSPLRGRIGAPQPAAPSLSQSASVGAPQAEVPVPKQTWRAAIRLPNGEVVPARENERIHAQIVQRLIDENHPNVIGRTDQDVDPGWVDDAGNFLTNDEMSQRVGYNADTFRSGVISAPVTVAPTIEREAQNAVPIRSTETIPVGQAPENRGALGTRVPGEQPGITVPQGQPETPQAQAPRPPVDWNTELRDTISEIQRKLELEDAMGEVRRRITMREGEQPPAFPRLRDIIPGTAGMTPEQRKAAYQNSHEVHAQWERDLADWESQQPMNRPIIFESENLVHAITPNIGGGWRVTGISRRDRMPTGHEVFKTRLEALRDQVIGGGARRVRQIGFEVVPLPERMFPGDDVIWRAPNGEEVRVNFRGFLGGEQAGQAAIFNADTGAQLTVDAMQLHPIRNIREQNIPPLPEAAKSGTLPETAGTETTGTVRSTSEAAPQGAGTRSTEAGNAAEMTAEAGEIPARPPAVVRSEISKLRAQQKKYLDRARKLGKLGENAAAQTAEHKAGQLVERITVLRGELSRAEAAVKHRPRKSVIGQGITEADGLLFDIVGSIGKLPIFLPPGWVVAKIQKYRARMKAGDLLRAKERDEFRNLMERYPENYEDDFGVNGEVMRAAYKAAKAAGIAEELFRVFEDGRNMRLDVTLDAIRANTGKEYSAVELYRLVEGLARAKKQRDTQGEVEELPPEAEHAKEQVQQDQRFFKDINRNTPGTLTIPQNEIVEGARFRLKGARVRIARVTRDEDGYITEVVLDDGKRYGTQIVDGRLALKLRADENSLKLPKGTAAEESVEFLTPEEQAYSALTVEDLRRRIGEVASMESMNEAGRVGINLYTDANGDIVAVGNFQDIFPDRNIPAGLVNSTIAINTRNNQPDYESSRWGEGVNREKIQSQINEALGVKAPQPPVAPEPTSLAGLRPGGTATPAAPAKPAGPAVDLFGNPIEQPAAPKPAAPETQIELAQPALEPRPLTAKEKAELSALVLKARAARDEGGEPLTPDETKRYNDLTALAGQKELLAEDRGAAIEAQLKQLRDKREEMWRQRDLAVARYQKAKVGSQVAEEIAQWTKAIDEIQGQIAALERQAPAREQAPGPLRELGQALEQRAEDIPNKRFFDEFRKLDEARRIARDAWSHWKLELEKYPIGKRPQSKSARQAWEAKRSNIIRNESQANFRYIEANDAYNKLALEKQVEHYDYETYIKDGKELPPEREQNYQPKGGGPSPERPPQNPFKKWLKTDENMNQLLKRLSDEELRQAEKDGRDYYNWLKEEQDFRRKQNDETWQDLNPLLYDADHFASDINWERTRRASEKGGEPHVEEEGQEGLQEVTPKTPEASLSQSERDFAESLAEKYGSPVAPITPASEPHEAISRFSDMLERAADRSHDETELAQILSAASGKPQESRIAWAIANNPHSSAETFAEAKNNPALRSMTTDENIASLSPRRAELREQRGLRPDIIPPAQGPAQPASAAGAALGTEVNGWRKTERGWEKLDDDGNIKLGKNGKKLPPAPPAAAANLEKYAANPPPAETRTNAEILSQAADVRVALKNATAIRVTFVNERTGESNSRVFTQSQIKNSFEKGNTWQGQRITNVEAGMIGSKDQFIPQGSVTVLDASRGRDLAMAEIIVPESEREKLYTETLGRAQRGKPESAMLQVQKTGGGVLSVIVEHVGDITHRMADPNTWTWGGYEYVKEKTERGLRYLTSRYGFMREFSENIEGNAKYFKRSTDEQRRIVSDALKKYAEEHEKLPVYNRAQEAARDAAIAIGHQDWYTAITRLEYLKSILDKGQDAWIQAAHAYDADVVARNQGMFDIEGSEKIARPAKDNPLLTDNAVRGKFIKEVLQGIMDAGLFDSRPVVKMVLERVLKFAGDTRIFLVDPAISDEGLVHRGASGWYHDGKRQIRLKRDKFGNALAQFESVESPRGIYLVQGRWNSGNIAFAVRVLAHEYIHAITADFIRANPGHVLVKQLADLARASYDLARKSNIRDLPYGLSRVGPQGWQNGVYIEGPAHESIHEFVAEALASKKFQKFLSEQKAPSWAKGLSSMWDAFVSIVRKILGLPEGTMLEHAIGASMKLIEEAQLPKEKLTEQFKPRTQEQMTLEWLMRADEGDLPMLVRTPREFELREALGEEGHRAAVVGGYAERVRAIDRVAEALGISERSKALLRTESQREMLSQAEPLTTARSYTEAKDIAPTEGQKSEVMRDAFESIEDFQFRGNELLKRRDQLTDEIRDPKFRALLTRTAEKQDRAEMLADIKRTFLLQTAAAAGRITNMLERQRIVGTAYEQLQADLERVRRLPDYSNAVAQTVDRIVQTVAVDDIGISVLAAGGSRDGRDILNEYFRHTLAAGEALPSGDSHALLELSAAVLAANRDLRNSLTSLAILSRDISMQTEVNNAGRRIASEIINNPAKAIPRLATRVANMTDKAARAEMAWLALHRKVQKKLDLWNKYDEAVRLHQAVSNDPEWQAHVNAVNRDVEGLHIPDEIRATMPAGKPQPFFELKGHQTLYAPNGQAYPIRLDWTPETVHEAQDRLVMLKSQISDWLDDPMNATSPARKYWEERQTLIENVLMSSAIWNPTAIIPPHLGKLGMGSLGMPEIFYQGLALPDAKLAYRAQKGFDIYWTQAKGWYSKNWSETDRAIERALASHGYSDKQRKDYQTAILNAIAWSYRHGKEIHAGDILHGYKITPADMALFFREGRDMREAYDTVYRARDVAGAELVSEMPRIIAEFTGGAWGIRKALELGVRKGTTLSRRFSYHGKILAKAIHGFIEDRDAALADLGKIAHTLPEAEVAQRRAWIAEDYFRNISRYLNDEGRFKDFLVSFTEDRSSDWLRKYGLSPFEEHYREMAAMRRANDPDVPQSLDQVIGWIADRVDGEWTPEMVWDQFLKEITALTEDHYKLNADLEANPAVTIISNSKNTAFNTAWSSDMGPAYFYDYGWTDAGSMRDISLDMASFGFDRLMNSMIGLRDAMEKAIFDLKGASQGWKKEQVRLGTIAYKQGRDFRDLQHIEDKLSELNRFIKAMPSAWMGERAVASEGMGLGTVPRVMNAFIQAALTGLRTATRISGITMGGSAWKMANVMAQLGYGRFRSYPYAALSAIMSMARLQTATAFGWYHPGKGFVPGVPLRMAMNVPKAIKAAAKEKGPERFYSALEKSLQGTTDEQFAVLRYWFDQKELGMTPNNPIGAKVAADMAASRTRGGIFTRGNSYPQNVLGEAWQIGKLAVSKPWAAGEAALDWVGAYLPQAFGYNITYDAVGRMAGWYMDMLATQARRTFETYEKLGQLGRFDFNRLNDPRNTLAPWEVLPSFFGKMTFVDPKHLPPWARPNSTNLAFARELFHTSTSYDLQDLVLRYYKRLAATPKEQRGDVEFMAPDIVEPVQARKVAENRARGIISRFVEQTHHAAPSNRPYWLQKTPHIQFILPFLGWSAQTIKQNQFYMGKAAYSVERDSKPVDTRTGLMIAAALTALGMASFAFLGGDFEIRFLRWLDRLVHHKEAQIKTIDEAKDAKEAAEIAVHNMTAGIPLLNSTLNTLVGSTGYRGTYGFQAFGFDKINALFNYLRGVYRTKDMTYGLERLAETNIPITETVIENLFQRQGFQNSRNAVRALQKFGPEEMVERRASASISLPTELTPLRMALQEAVFSGRTDLVQKAAQAFVEKAREIGRPDPEKTLAQTFSTLNPYRQSFGGLPTEEERRKAINQMDDFQRQVVLDAERNYSRAAGILGFTSNFTKDEYGTAPALAAGGGGASATVRTTGLTPRRISLGGATRGLGGGGYRALGGFGRRLVRSGRTSLRSARSRNRLVSGRIRLRSGRVRRLGTVRRPRARRITLV